ncbi:hypothetical protein [Pedobacter punctiformis]|uniref:Uncharacterized protein n=1 Tax=Pedobacter punctiformis TaxID=3004097 RepID=A0ABT4L5W7_9SPHI|nr:hypothetical protein [Pedobacter sp. HCMS5-2]MCZ4243316.1 hypothetical protein [Pedobacter sp. HCMS5-2]
MKNYLFIYILIIVGFCVSCQKSNESVSYDSLKLKNYNTLSAKDQKIFSEELVIRLKKDSDFIAFNKSLDAIMLAYAAKEKTIGERQSIGQRVTYKDRYEYFKSIGIGNPGELIKNQTILLISQSRLGKKFPELRTMDKSTRQHIMSEAKGGMSKEMKIKLHNRLNRKMELLKLKESNN